MITETGAPVMRDAAVRLVFAKALEPLPLVDPTEAARFLNVKRHTLACYRNLCIGPPYYKFGRWIRYAWADLVQWSDRSTDDLLPSQSEVPPGTMLLVDVDTAAHFLTLTRFCLTNYRAGGGGPRFRRFGRRIHYTVDDLRSWAEQQRYPPLAEPTFRAKSGMIPVLTRSGVLPEMGR